MSKNIKKFTKKYGFTLLEIIVVMVILGVLTAIAIPSYNNIITQARMQGEGLDALRAYAPVVEGCMMKVGYADDYNACLNGSPGSIPGPDSTANFDYVLTSPPPMNNPAQTGYVIYANGKNTYAPGDIITITRSAASWPAIGTVTCSGQGVFAGISC